MCVFFTWIFNLDEFTRFSHENYHERSIYAYTWRFCLINFQIYVSSQIWLVYKIRYKTWWKHMNVDIFLPVSCCCTAMYLDSVKAITAVTRQAVEEAKYYWLISGKTKTLCTKNWMKYYLKLNIELRCKHIQTCTMVKSELEMLEIFWQFENIIQCRLIVDCVILYSLR